jgi:RHH-type transcriptional regulator, rel operon repressor / antitoxin RelB
MSTANKTTTFSVRVARSIEKRLEKLAKSTGRSRAFLAAEAIHEYLEVNEWQIARIHQAITSLDAGKGIPHERVKEWFPSWGTPNERPLPVIT